MLEIVLNRRINNKNNLQIKKTLKTCLFHFYKKCKTYIKTIKLHLAKISTITVMLKTKTYHLSRVKTDM